MPITKWDDYLIHQTADTIDTGVNNDPDFMDRLYIGCHSQDGTIHLAVGLGTYPNKNIMDGFVIIRLNDIQHNLVLSRYLNGDRSDMQIGPLIGDGSLVLFEDGESLLVSAEEEPVRLLLVSGKPIAEPVAWRGPIVMNTGEELQLAFEEYNNGTFIKHKEP